MTDFTDPNFIESKGDSLIKRRLRTKKVFSKAPIPSDTENDANKILSMLFDLEKGLSSAEKKSVTDELLRWARSLGSGTPENRGVEYKRVKAAFDESNEIKKSFVTALNSSSAETRSWSAAFIRQLFDKDEAVNLILSALSNESNSNAASWLSLSLSRLERDNPQICEAIAAAYKKFMGKFFCGYSNCKGMGLRRLPGRRTLSCAAFEKWWP